MTKRRYVSDRLSKIILVLLGTLIALIIAEFAARLLGPPYGERGLGYRQCDRLVGWRGIPNVSMELNMEGYQHQVVWNSRGMHDGEHSVEKEEGVFRIMMLGDSFVEAVEVEESQTSHQVLEDLLNARAPSNIKFEVISVGAVAWGPVQELMYFRSEGRVYQPDLVLVLWFPFNDLSDVIPDIGYTIGGLNCYAPYFAMCNGRFDPEPWFSAPGIPATWKECSASKKILARGLNRLYYNSHLYQRLEPFLTEKIRGIPSFDLYSPFLESERANETLVYSYQLNSHIYSHLVNEVSQIGAKTAFIVVPVKRAVYYEIDPIFRASLQAEFPALEKANPRFPNQLFIELMEMKGLPVLDLHPYFVTHLQEEGVESLYWEFDGHWNIIGNQIAAQDIANWLIEQKLVPLTY